MKKSTVLRQEDFDNLLAWLAPEREEAGRKYEEIRQGLIRLFRFRGCNDPLSLADETINRLATKVSSLNKEGEYKTITYFYGFASKIYLEYLNQRKGKETQLEMVSPLLNKHEVNLVENDNENHQCLDDCLAKLETRDKELILTYYSQEKKAKLDLRKKLAQSLNLNTGALHVRVYRLRLTLKKCIEDCLNKK